MKKEFQYTIQEFSSSTNQDLLKQIYKLNQENTPEVGNLASIKELQKLVMLSSSNYYISIQDAVIAFGGETSPGALSTTSDNYDGTTWTGGTAMTTGHKNISCGGWGTKTATLAAFGQDNSSRLGTTQEYNISVNTQIS